MHARGSRDRRRSRSPYHPFGTFKRLKARNRFELHEFLRLVVAMLNRTRLNTDPPDTPAQIRFVNNQVRYSFRSTC